MEEFPFTEAEWQAVSDAALILVNAELANDPVLRASLLLGLRDMLAGLRERYGEHPVLLETEADFAEDDDERIVLYQRALSVATAHGLPTHTIRLSLAQLQIEVGDSTAAPTKMASSASEGLKSDECP